jgi:hypothetical protein
VDHGRLCGALQPEFLSLLLGEMCVAPPEVPFGLFEYLEDGVVTGVHGRRHGDDLVKAV